MKVQKSFQMLSICILAALAAIIFCNPCMAVMNWYPIDPRSTYLRTDSTDTDAQQPLVIDLQSIGFSQNQYIYLIGVGDFSYMIDGPEIDREIMGVFSSSATILSSDNLNRIPGAIDTGVDFYTEATCREALDTDILEDFQVSWPSSNIESITIQIPTGANYLILGFWDAFYGDNTDPDGDLKVGIAPEPTTLLLLGLGGLILRRRK